MSKDYMPEWVKKAVSKEPVKESAKKEPKEKKLYTISWSMLGTVQVDAENEEEVRKIIMDREYSYLVETSWDRVVEIDDIELANKEASLKTATNNPVPFENWGSFFWIENGKLMGAPMYQDGHMPDEDEKGEVTAPESQEFLDDINKQFGTSFKLEDFPGR